MRKPILAMLLASSLLLSACSRDYDNPSVSEQDRAQAAEQHPLLLAEFGGEYAGPEAAYVKDIGETMASAAGLGDSCTFTMVNTDVVNAFAVPGCYIYVTRGLFALVNSEAELASVLGHEVGHIVAEHSERRQRRALFSGIGATLVGLVTGSERLARIAGGAAQLYTLRYSRNQEYESDDLGIRYLVEAGYDPFSASDMLDALDKNDRLLTGVAGMSDATSIPAWARTHPLTADRIERANDEAADTGQSRGSLPEKEEPYLREVDGLLYGDDPEQGFVLGRRFAHPQMRISFEAPEGFGLINTPRAVLINGPDGLRGEFGGGRLGRGGLPEYASAVIEGLLGQAQVPVQPGEAVATEVNGVPALIAPVTVQTEQGVVEVTVAAYAGPGGSAYHFVMLSPAGGAAARSLAPLYASFRLLDQSEVQTLRPRIVRVVTARPGDTVQSMAARMAYDDHKLARFLTLNDRDANEAIQPGEKMKLVLFAR